jgi:hypothetical protein
MNRKHFLLFAICMGCLYSCATKNNTPTPVSPIVGTWSLKQQHVQMYQDTTTLTDTTLSAATTAYGTAQFNADGTYSTSGVYLAGNGSSLSSPPPSDQKSSGKYNYSDNIFTVSAGLAGWYTYAFGTTGPISNIVFSIHITQLTSTKLTVHMEDKFVATTVTGTHTFDEVLDYYYSK